ncbi:MAG: ABC transporter permease subunit, partial [bacterium]|nr:ABC transporter permease subunit [bacterium]
MLRYPRAWVIPIKDSISEAMYWLVEEATFGFFTVREAFRFFASIIEIPLDLAINILATGVVEGTGSNAIQELPPLGWIAIISLDVAMGRRAGGWRVGRFAAGCFLYLLVFQQWQSAMRTLASIVVAVPFAAAGGLAIGVACYKWKWVEKITRPVLDLMQTVPIFAYLVPILFLFGFGPVSAMIATIIYAMPPMVRTTTLGLQEVSEEISDFGHMVGCDQRQLMYKVLIPCATSTLMVGVNQVIMLSLNMVIIASMIGAGGLGYDVLVALRRLDIGGGLEAGIAIVVLAIAIDRLSHGFATRRPDGHETVSRSFAARHPRKIICGLITFVTYAISLWHGPVLQFPAELQVTTANLLDDGVRYLNVNFYSVFESIKLFFLKSIMLPVKFFITGIPWPWTFIVALLAGYQLGGIRLAALCLGLLTFVLTTGQWEKAMITVYLCGTSVALATLMGIPLGVLAAENQRAGKFLYALTDTLQTLPSFVYLIPVVMFFQSGDFSAMIAVVLYALAPAIRYTAHGVSSVDPDLVEAG